MSAERLEDAFRQLLDSVKDSIKPILEELDGIQSSLGEIDFNDNSKTEELFSKTTKLLGKIKSKVDTVDESFKKTYASKMRNLKSGSVRDDPLSSVQENGVLNGLDGEEDEGEKKDSNVNALEDIKPLGKIKLVDINKLLDPKALTTKSNSGSKEDSIWIISDSEDDSSKKGSRLSGKKPPPKVVKKVDSQNKARRPRVVSSKKISLVDISSDSDVSSRSSERRFVRKDTPYRKKSRNSRVQESEDEAEREPPKTLEEFFSENPKLGWKAFVKLPRVQAEKMLSDYYEQFERIESTSSKDKEKEETISKRKRSEKADSSSSSDANTPKKTKRSTPDSVETSTAIDLDGIRLETPEKEVSKESNGPGIQNHEEGSEATNEASKDSNKDHIEDDSIDTTKENSEDTPNKSDNAKKDENQTSKSTEESSHEEDSDHGKKAKKESSSKKKKSKSDGSDEDDSEDQGKNHKTKEFNSKKKKSKSDESDDDSDVQGKKSKAKESSSKKKQSKSDESDDSDDDGKKAKKAKGLRKKQLKSDESDNDSDDRSEKGKSKESSSKKKKAKSDESDDDDCQVINSSDSGSDSDVGKSKKKSKNDKRSVKKRRKVISDSESGNGDKYSGGSDSNDENSDSDEEVKPKQNKKSRIKKMSSDEDVDEDKNTRKHIRKILSKGKLEDSTLQAEKDERERKARIAEKQKKYNSIFNPDELEKDTVDKVVLDFDEETNEELLSVDPDLVKHLKPHQANGIQFMWNACFESLKRIKKKDPGSGCILGHCMGLGKTLQIITLTHTLLTNSEKTKISKVLVVCPLSTVLNWQAEFQKWLPDNDDFEVYELISYKKNSEREFYAKEWQKNGGVLILGYDMFRNLSNDRNSRIPKKMRATFQSCLVDPGPDMVVCDEGHLLKNEKTSLSIAMNKIKTLRRIVLTGTPLQNNLREYYCMVQFIKPNLLGTFKEYSNRFVNPITNGQYNDSTDFDIQLMRRRSHILHKLLDGVIQRRDYAVLAPFLPPKLEFVLFISLTETQSKLYQHYMQNYARRVQDGGKRVSSLFVDFQNLQRMCTHPRVLLDKSIEMKKKREMMSEDESEGSLKDFIDDKESSAGSSTDSSDNDSDKKSKSSGSEKGPPPKRRTRANAAEFESDNEEEVEKEDDDPLDWWRQFCTGDQLDNIAHSGKMMLLFEILKECELIGDKVLIFSQSLYSLNCIEYFLQKIDEATQAGETDKVCGFTGSWSLGLDYYRLDGSMSCDNRQTDCKNFNDPNNTRARLFLISTRAGGLGINLVAANRVIIFDVSWNPSHDIQSIYRVYRFGQTKPTYVYRFVSLGAMEMKVYERQVTKQAISKRVIDEQQIDRHYNQNDLAELYNFEPNPGERPVPLVPKDVLLAELLQNHEKLLYKYHEHQSLLENKEEETLNEEERKAAWEEFENEKKARPPAMANFSSIPLTMIYRAVAQIVKRDNPSWDATRIQSLLPTIVKELTNDIAVGNMNKYARVLAEVRLIQQADYQQQLQYQHQVSLQMFQQYQQQFMNANNTRDNRANLALPNPGTSRMMQQTSNEVIDLND